MRTPVSIHGVSVNNSSYVQVNSSSESYQKPVGWDDLVKQKQDEGMQLYIVVGYLLLP